MAALPRPLSPFYSYLELELASQKFRRFSREESLENEEAVYLSIPFPKNQGDKIGLAQAFKEWYNYHTFISLWESLYGVGSQIYDVVEVIGIHKGTNYAIMGSLKGKGELVFKASPLEPARVKMGLPSHEVVIGAVLNSLREFCPSFAMVFGSFECGSPVVVDGGVVVDWCRGDNSQKRRTISENVQITSEDDDTWEVTKGHVEMEYVIYEYIKQATQLRDHLSDPQTVLSILGQVIMSLHIAFRKYNFSHGDFHIGNIVIRDLPDYRWVRYSADEGDFWIYTKVIPTIIDYGRSALEYEGILIPNEIQEFSITVLDDIFTFIKGVLKQIRYYDRRHKKTTNPLIYEVCEDFKKILTQKTHKKGEMITPLELLRTFSKRNGFQGTFIFKDSPGKGKILNPKKYPLHHA